LETCRSASRVQLTRKSIAPQLEWTKITSAGIVPGQSRPKRVIGSRKSRVCRFCGRPRPEANFSNDAHVIPAAFGNRSLFTNEECDDCNSEGSRYEDDLASFLALHRVLSRIPGRKKPPKLRHPGDTSYAQALPAKNLVLLRQSNNEQSFQASDNGKGKLTIVSRMPKFRTVNVARSLGRMALFLLDQSDKSFQSLHKWITGKTECFPMPMEVFNFPGTGFREVEISVGKFENIPGRELIVVRFTFFTCVISIPFPLDGLPIPNDLPLMNLHRPGMPRSIKSSFRQNTSRFLINSCDPIVDGKSTVVLDYNTRDELGSFEELIGKPSL